MFGNLVQSRLNAVYLLISRLIVLFFQMAFIHNEWKTVDVESGNI